MMGMGTKVMKPDMSIFRYPSIPTWTCLQLRLGMMNSQR
jgi:hypothetical protein